jgi:hypothetical protein
MYLLIKITVVILRAFSNANGQLSHLRWACPISESLTTRFETVTTTPKLDRSASIQHISFLNDWSLFLYHTWRKPMLGNLEVSVPY